MRDYWTAREAAEKLKWHYSTLMRRIYSSKVRAAQVGKRWRVSKAEVRRLRGVR